MEHCELCEIAQYTPHQLSPKGTSTPSIYFVGEAPGPEEKEVGTPFIGRAGKYLHNMLDVFGLNENNCRFFNILRCYPQKSAEDSGFRVPNTSEISTCLHYVVEDIVKTNPKVIVCLGNTSSRAIIGEPFTSITKCHGMLYTVKFGDTEFKVIPMYHPSYLIRNEGNAKLRVEFKKDIQEVISVCKGTYSSTSRNNKRDFSDDTVLIKTYQEFNQFMEEEIDSRSEISYDIETNALDKNSRDFNVVGFSLASRNDKGCYVVLNSLDYDMPELDRRRVEARLRKMFLTNKHFNVYNCMHEIPATLNWLGVEMQNVDDIFVMVKLMMGNADKYQGNGGLKIQSEMNLHYNDWSQDLDLYFEYLRSLKTSRDKMESLLSKYYSSSEMGGILDFVDDCYVNLKSFVSDNGVISYGCVPYKLIGKYGGIDAEVLFDLKEYYIKLMKEKSKEYGINLFQGYEYWMCHHLAGYILERNGAHWDDKVATDVENWCNDGMVDSLNALISSPISEEYIRDKLYDDFIRYIKDNYLESILGDSVVPKRLYKNSVHVVVYSSTESPLVRQLKNMSLEPNSKGIVKLELGHIQTLSKPFLDKHPEIFEKWYTDYMSEYSKEKHTVDDMKKLLNPNATNQDFRNFVSNLLITPEIRYAKLYSELVLITEFPSFDVEKYYSDDHKLLELILKLRNMEMDATRRVQILIKFISGDVLFKSWQVKKAVSNAMEYKLETLDDDSILELYEYMRMSGVDIEKEETWTPQFTWMYNFRIFKKYSKILSVYIDGRVGRNNVWSVDPESLSSGDMLTVRQDRYNKTSDKRELISQAEFKVDMAGTGRWKSGMHTLPAGDTIKKIYNSRFRGGIIAMPDCAQAEVRVLAAQCQDENLLQAFKDGLDIHRYVASLVFHGGDQDAVTSTERKIAKGAVFGILYGESERAFADMFTKGDEKEAHKIFEYFWSAFPKIKQYVEESHRQCTDNQLITLMTDRFISMADEIANNKTGDTDKVLRQAQNFRIQGATCDIAGMILWNICQYIKEHNMLSKPFCFIHDSIEIDVHPSETFQLIDILQNLFNRYPMETFGVPMASDIPIGPSMGQEIEVENMEHDSQYQNIIIDLKGFKDDIEELQSIWENTYHIVERDLSVDPEIEKIYLPRSGLFQKKVTMSRLIGTERESIKCRFKVSV